MDADFVASLVEGYSPRKKALVGVSGGRDSVVLLHGLKAAGFSHLVVCHLNHRLRGRASTADAAFVRRLAARLGFLVEIGVVDVKAMARDGKSSIETAARHARHAFFAAMGRKHRCRRVFLAHHADDQVETVLHQVCRGSGMRGLAGMASPAKLDVPLASGRPVSLEILRPLLGTWREEIDAWAKAGRITFREDASNADGDLSTRNRWRHDLLPAIRDSLGRDPGPSLLRLAEIVRAEEDAIESHLCQVWPEILVDRKAGKAEPATEERLRLSALRQLPLAWQRRVIKRWLESAAIPDISFDLVERVRAILPSRGAPASKVNLPGGNWVRRRSGELFIDHGVSRP